MNNYEGNNNTFVKYKTPSPCFNCIARKTYCHTSCKKYNEYLQIHEKEKELIRKEIDATTGNCMDDHVLDILVNRIEQIIREE